MNSINQIEGDLYTILTVVKYSKIAKQNYVN